MVPLALAAVNSTANPSRSPNHVASDTNLDGLSVAVVSHAFNSFESMHHSTISSSLRSSTPLHRLSASSVFLNTSVLLDAKLCMDFSSVCICSGAAAAGRHLQADLGLVEMADASYSSLAEAQSTAFTLGRVQQRVVEPIYIVPSLSRVQQHLGQQNVKISSQDSAHQRMLEVINQGFLPGQFISKRWWSS